VGSCRSSPGSPRKPMLKRHVSARKASLEASRPRSRYEVSPRGRYSSPAGSVFRLGARGQCCSAARLHLCFGIFAFGTFSLVSIVSCTHPGTFCPGLILFYSPHFCARGRYSSLPRFWAHGERPMSHRSALSEPSSGPFGIRSRAKLARRARGCALRQLRWRNAPGRRMVSLV
jgi:hypothetical protein